MKNELQCKAASATVDNGALAGLLQASGRTASEMAPLLSPAEELRLARQEGLQAFAAEKTVWLWLAASALVVLGLSFLG